MQAVGINLAGDVAHHADDPPDGVEFRTGDRNTTPDRGRAKLLAAL